MKKLIEKKEVIEKKYEDNIMEYLTNHESSQLIIPKSKLEKKVIKELLLKYSNFLSGNTKELLDSFIGKEEIKIDINKNMRSKNPWKNRIGTYQIGEFGFTEYADTLLKQLDTEDRELLYITARALIKLEGKTHLKDILDKISINDKMKKNNILTLVEMIDDDIRDVLDEIMKEENSLLNTLGLELYGERQYMEGIEWINKMIFSPEKEVRIAVLKAAHKLGDVGDEEYLKKILSLEVDKEWEVRAFLAKFLINVKNTEAINSLIRLIKDQNWLVRYNAANSLGNQGERGLNALINLLNSEDKFARDKAKEMIEKEIIFHKLFSNLDESLKNKLLYELKIDMSGGEE
ncbi:hypothetical protein J2Z35_002799 [Acetoanaerobium pronyense]|uniref:HEAT repeat domain-containing protein n=1 Tax=Acetoanaerobium pronyense TaxID=1482736 RepID=A0ABS4KMF9_9FIRM|nr:HEAT repeat domain-containing protein [Acetoanaerobium pronyense]MBP2028961.1 hypothetical protein [Acetoanaerobium pronyense]